MRAWVVAAATLLVAGQARDAGSGPAIAPGAPTPGAPRTTPAWVAVPSGWRPLAELVPNGGGSARPGEVRVEEKQGFGDPASGCFALVERVTAPGSGFALPRVGEALLRDLQAGGFTAGPAGPGGAELSFAGRGVQGRIRAITAPDAGGRIAVLSVACFYNDREPDRCRPACDAMLDSAGARR